MMSSIGGNQIEMKMAGKHEEEEQLQRNSLSASYNQKSAIQLCRIDSNSSIFRGEDPELVSITLRSIRNTDRNNDGRLDIDEVGWAILAAVKEARKASKKEKKLKRIIGGLGGFLIVFALIFLGVQGVSLGNSIDEAKITAINKDTYGHAHLQDKSGSDLSTRSFGDKIVVESKLDLYSGRMLQCASPSNVAAMTNDVINGVDANIVVNTPAGLPGHGVPLSGEFSDSSDKLRFGDDKVVVLMDSNACNTATANPQDDEDGDAESNTQDEGVSDRHLYLRHSAAAPIPSSLSAAVLAKNRELYSMAMTAHHEGRVLTGDGSLQVELSPWDQVKCTVLPAHEEAVKASTDGIACPAMRFLIKQALQDGLFDLCGYGDDSYMVDTLSMKKLLTDGIGNFVGLQRDKVMSNVNNLSVFDRAFSGAIDSQSAGVLKHAATNLCVNIGDYQYSSDSAVSPGSTINLDISCSGNAQRWKLRSSPDDASIRIHHRRSEEYCLSLDDADAGVQLRSCADAGDKAKWKLDSAGRIQNWGGDDDSCIGVVSSNIILQGCNSDAVQVWVPPPVINAAHLEDNFDHSASSGIIGAATAIGDDNNSFNEGRYNEFLGQLCNGCDPASLSADTVFTESDFGRAVNHFGDSISNPTVMSSTKVGAFSWAILTFEWSNTFVAFKKNGKFPLSTFMALFLPDQSLIEAEMLSADTLTTSFVPTIERDVLGADEVHYLSNTIESMGIQISCGVKAAMVQAVVDCNCDSSPSCGACGFNSLFTDLCGEGYEHCVESGCPE